MFILFWTIKFDSRVFLSLACVLIGYQAIFRTIGFNKQNNSENGISIMSYNIGGTHHHFSAKNKKERIDQFKKLIFNLEPDVVCLQERKAWMIPIFDEIFSDYNNVEDEKLKTCIYSKLPIVNHGNISFGKEYHSASWVDIAEGSDKYRIYGLHLSSNKVPEMSDNLEEIIDESLFILDKYGYHAGKRWTQLQTIMKHAQKSVHPVVITGDFNDMPQSYLYRQISQVYKDAFVESGSGFGKTQNAWLPGLRIDYAFVDKELDILDHKILKSDLSDHSPIVTRINSK